MSSPPVIPSSDPATPIHPRFKLEAPWLILAALMLATFVSAYQNYRQSRVAAETRFGEIAYATKLALADDIHRTEDLLRSASALVSAVPEIDQHRWDSFFNARADNYSEYYGLIAVQYTTAGQAPAKGERKPRLQRFYSASFDIPLDNALADLPVIADAIRRAEANRSPALSEPISSQPPSRSTLVAVVIPVYPSTGALSLGAAPLANPIGHLVGLIRLDDVMAHLVKQRGRNLALTLLDADHVMSAIVPAGMKPDPAFTSKLTVNLGQRPWTLSVQSTPLLEAELLSSMPETILAVGVLGTLLLAGLVWLLTRLREQAESLAQRMTEQLRDQVKFTEDLIEFNPNPIFRIDDRGRYVSVNRAWEQLSGRNRQDVLGKTYSEFLSPTLAAQNLANDSALFASSSGYAATEGYFTSAEGRQYETIVAKQVLRRLDGKIDGLIGTITDVTPIKRLEREVQRQREQLDLVISSSQQGIWDIELRPGGAQYFSERFREMLGYTNANFPARFDWEDHGHPDDQTAFRAEIKRHFQGLTPYFDQESRVRRRDGEYLWVRTRAIAQRGEDGRAVRFVGSIVDITDRKLAEASLIEASARVTEAARAKEAFLATMSHEIRTPLNGVLGMTGLLSETRLNDEQRDYIRLIRASGDTLLRLIDDVLDFSKIESGRMTLESVPVETVTLIEDAMELVAEKAREKDIELLYEAADDVPFYIIGDPTRLRQILLNLLSNALKFTQRGEIKVSVSVKPATDGKLELECRVKDSGIGIPESRIGQLFQPFTQVDASTTRKYGGTGLGLAICKRLTQQMGGDIHVESVEGEGATFIFRIQTQAARGPLRPYMQRDVFDFLDKRLLAIDRSDSRLGILQHRYSRWGFEFSGARHDDATAAFRKGPPFDIVLTDMVLPSPELDQFCQALAEDDAVRDRKGVPRVAIILQSTIGRAELSQRHITPQLRHEMFIVRPAGQLKMFDALMRATLHQPNHDIATRPFTPEPIYDPEFTSRLRASKTADQQPDAESPGPAHVIPGQPSLEILVAEDNEINQRVIQGMLTNLGHHSTVVADGRLAVAAAQAGTYAFILMDIHMPELDGLGAMHEIRKLLGERCPPIIAMTAHALSGDREQYLAAGMDDYISKPIRTADLTALVERLSQRQGSRPSAQTEATVPMPAQLSRNTIDALPILDTEQLEDLRYLPAAPGESGGGDSAVGGLIKLFQTKALERMTIMENCLASGNWKDLAETAHSLRGASASMGFPRVASLCKDLELSARRLVEESGSDAEALPTQHQLDEVFEQIKHYYTEADEALTAWLTQTAPAEG
jgi:PAS domain S-box-containing protein